ncbi:unnamed protein product [Kluyveromyces dobzhanskii CBS 2104]|uniref:WGS project CCBQ000000000 data, contig MAT n=1 Tax=Kluyveromyces dobzhanskii CBS 2104 TaxID=1427455 RepID=A0A0A8L3I5_9SACH|nr:unnamed protein product [Kluyveromyces dobzhanskii CBS 2104]
MSEFIQDLQAILPLSDDPESRQIIEWFKVLLGATDEAIHRYLPIWCFSYLKHFSRQAQDVTVAEKWKLVQYWVSNPSLRLNTGVSALRLDESYTFQLPEQWSRSVQKFGLWVQLDEPNKDKSTPFYAQITVTIGDEEESFEYVLFDKAIKLPLNDILDEKGLYLIKFETEKPIDIPTINSLKTGQSIVDCKWIFDVELLTGNESGQDAVSLPLGRVLCVDTCDYHEGTDYDYIYVPAVELLSDFLLDKSDNTSLHGQLLQEIEPELYNGSDLCWNYKSERSFIVNGEEILEMPINFYKPHGYIPSSIAKISEAYRKKVTFTNRLDSADDGDE